MLPVSTEAFQARPNISVLFIMIPRPGEREKRRESWIWDQGKVRLSTR